MIEARTKVDESGSAFSPPVCVRGKVRILGFAVGTRFLRAAGSLPCKRAIATSHLAYQLITSRSCVVG